MRVLALIPARGGSKGVPRKNVRLLGGQPLIAYSIKAARDSRRVTAVVTTTDDEEIAETARRFGSDTLKRPPALAEDDTPMLPVAIDALEKLAGNGREFDVLMLLQCTCPFRTAADIDGALDALTNANADAVIGVRRVWDEHPARMYKVADGRLVPYDQTWETANRQDLPAAFHRNGAIYGIRTAALRRERTFMPRGSVPYVMPAERSINIDEEFDFFVAECLIQRDRREDPQS